MNIGIIGAGVSGLTTGILLQELGYDVTIYTHELYPKINSNAACAIWLPLATSNKDEPFEGYNKLVNDWSFYSWNRFEQLVDSNYGIKWVTNHELYQQEEDIPPHLLELMKSLPNFELVKDTTLPQPYSYRCSFQTFVIETPIYLPKLMDDFQSKGEIIIKKLTSIEDVSKLPHKYVFNCSGLGARDLVSDIHLRGIKGQLVILEKYDIDFAVGADWYCIIPRSDGLLIGVLFQEDFKTIEPTDENTSELLRAAKNLANSDSLISLPLNVLHESKVTGAIAGLRPYRSTGVRVEVETIENTTLIHNYGHGGGGVTLSWGCANYAIEKFLKNK